MPHPYRLDAATQALADRAATIARDVAAPDAIRVDAEAAWPTAAIAAIRADRLLGLTVPADLGGLGQGPRAFAGIVEELAQACGSTAMIYVMHVVATQAIASSSTLARRESVLRDIAAGKHLTTLAFSERGSRSQFWTPASKLVAKYGHFVTDADKSWVTAAHHADSYVSSAQKPNADSPFESTIYLLGRGGEGVQVASGFNGLGLRGNESAPVQLRGAVVQPADLISPLGEGATTMLQVVLPWFAIGTAAMANGLCRSALAATIAHVSGTGFETTGTQLRDLPNLRARIAEMSVRTEQARALLGVMLGEIEAPSEITPLFVLQSRMASIQAAVDVTDLAMKTCGGAAFSRHLGVERAFRDARAGWVMAPTVDHLQDFVGRALTGLPLF